MDLKERISRWMLAVGLWGCALWIARYGFIHSEFQWLPVAIIIGLIGLSRVFSDLLELAAKPFTMLVDAIIFPKITAGKPPPNYKVAEYYVEQKRWEEAEIEYRTILKNHRKEARAWLGLIRLLVATGDIEESKKMFRKAQRHLRSQPNALSEVEMEWHHLGQ